MSNAIKREFKIKAMSLADLKLGNHFGLSCFQSADGFDAESIYGKVREYKLDGSDISELDRYALTELAEDMLFGDETAIESFVKKIKETSLSLAIYELADEQMRYFVQNEMYDVLFWMNTQLEKAKALKTICNKKVKQNSIQFTYGDHSFFDGSVMVRQMDNVPDFSYGELYQEESYTVALFYCKKNECSMIIKIELE